MAIIKLMTLEEVIAAEAQQFSEHIEDVLYGYDAAYLISMGTYEIHKETCEAHKKGLKELMIAYAEQKCKEQREICAIEAGHKKHSPEIDRETIREAYPPKFD